MTRHRASARAYQTEHFNVRICPGSPRRSPTGFFRSRSRVDLLKCDTSPAGRGSFMNQFIFEPIRVNSNAPGGACILRTFDDVGAFIINNVDTKNRRSRHWQAVQQDLVQARFGARRAEAHAALRHALFVEGWLG